MSYILRCGCVGDQPVCVRHRANYIVKSSADPDSIEKAKHKEGKLNILLSGKNAKLNIKFNLAFFPSYKCDDITSIDKPFRKHEIIYGMLAEKHQGVLMCEQEELAANLISLQLLGIDIRDILIMTSLRTYDLQNVGGIHEDFFGYIIIFGNHDMDRLPKSCIHLGTQCLYERSFMQRDWVKTVLDYDATSPRTYLAAQHLNKTICIKTRYRELFNLIKGGTVTFNMLNCVVTNG